MTIPSISKVYADSCLNKPNSYYNYTDYNIEIGNIDDYKICDRIGRGRYSEVFKGIQCNNKSTKSFVAIKVLKPVREKKINREILILKNLKHSNIIEMIDIVKDIDSQIYSIIFEYISHRETRTILFELKEEEFLFYMKKILNGIEFAHSNGIIHRDIKPQNIIINKEKKECKIIDWGLAEFYLPNTEYNVKVASRFYKPPELLLNYNYYDYSLDLWSFGCILIEYYSKKIPFFCGKDNFDQLTVITDVLGKEDLSVYMKKYQIVLPEGINISKRLSRRKFTDDYEENVRKVIDGLLLYDHSQRLTANECLKSDLFKNVPDKI